MLAHRLLRSVQQGFRSSGFVRTGIRFTVSSAAAIPARTGLKGLLSTYLELSKFRLGSLVVFSTTAGFVFASGSISEWLDVDWAKCAWVSGGTALLVAAANTLNQVIERNRDKLMARTMKRPMPLMRVGIPHAIGFAVVCTGLGSYLLMKHSNVLTTTLGVSNLCLYAFIYTPLKMMHPVNTWVGAIVGALPPMMGCTATLGAAPSWRDIGADAYLLGALLFAWQMPHFLSLSYFIRNDYARAGYKMLSISNPAKCARIALRYCFYMLPVGAAAWLAGITDWGFAVDSALAAAYLIYKGLPFARNPSDLAARKLFRASLVYLPVVLLFALVHAKPQNERSTVQQQLGLIRAKVDV